MGKVSGKQCGSLGPSGEIDAETPAGHGLGRFTGKLAREGSAKAHGMVVLEVEDAGQMQGEVVIELGKAGNSKQEVT